MDKDRRTRSRKSAFGFVEGGGGKRRCRNREKRMSSYGDARKGPDVMEGKRGRRSDCYRGTWKIN
ncbi:hypothetical protein SLEP1_g55914 [Rubroshorea leprosula]|uniref:Uncharacterized protein n=1 Tax=Rubroshorea leprosula TaxID=152421 RepID=A0AAV5MGS8_9ROSI|nr:hypothetical protein SLEP1_g55914 [Rubroshorea leprosula]